MFPMILFFRKNAPYWFVGGTEAGWSVATSGPAVDTKQLVKTACWNSFFIALTRGLIGISFQISVLCRQSYYTLLR
jgi:hypothetical protein